MMKSEDSRILRQVCFNVFEQLAFMFGDEIENDELEIDADSFLRASMGFKGAKQGSVEIIVPMTISKLLACNILGLEEDQNIDQETAIDALKELLNTITGKLMTTMYGEDDVVDLSIPQTEEIDLEAWQSLVDSNAYIALTIEDTPILITMHSS